MAWGRDHLMVIPRYECATKVRHDHSHVDVVSHAFFSFSAASEGIVP